VFDCFDGTLFEYFRKTSDETSDYPAPPSRPTPAIIDDVWQNRDRDYNIRCLVKRLQRIDKQMSADARDQFAAFIPDGDVARFAAGLTTSLRQDFTGTMQVQSQLFTERRLEEAHRMRYQRVLVDVISMVKHAADEGQPLLTAEERVNRALAKLSEGRTFTDDQRKWLDRIGHALRETLRWSPMISASCPFSNAPAASALPAAPSARIWTSLSVT
jgi:hypothetical protein